VAERTAAPAPDAGALAPSVGASSSAPGRPKRMNAPVGGSAGALAPSVGARP
jgi:hypothetical protein